MLGERIVDVDYWAGWASVLLASPSLFPVLLPPCPHHVSANVLRVAQRRISAGLTPGAPLPAMTAIRGQVVRARAATRVRGDALGDHLLERGEVCFA